jgi:hypothetical protein
MVHLDLAPFRISGFGALQAIFLGKMPNNQAWSEDKGPFGNHLGCIKDLLWHCE